MLRELIVCAVVIAAPARLAGQDVKVETRPLANGSFLLIHELVVPASARDTWAAFATAEGLESWAVPFAEVDLRVGGIWESSYDAAASPGDSANIRTRFLAYVPERMLAMQAVAAPPGFPYPDVLPDLFSVIEFDPAGTDSTRVRMYGVGYRDTPDHVAVREMFARANAWSLDMLYRRFTEGPVDWEKVRGEGR